MKNNSVTIKVAWITGGCMIVAAIIYGLFGLFDNKSNNERKINQTIVAKDSSSVNITNNQNDVKGDYVKEDIKVNIQDSKLEKSPIIVDSPGAIVGDINVINKLDIPEPILSIEELFSNELSNDLYKSEFLLTIDTKVQIPQLYLELQAPTIIKMDVTAQRSGISMTGHSGKREGYVFTNLINAYGSYKIIVFTKKIEHFSLIYDYD